MFRYKLTFFVFQKEVHDETLEAEFAFEKPDGLAEALMRHSAQQSPFRMRKGVYSIWGDAARALLPGSLKKGYGPDTTILITKFELVDSENQKSLTIANPS